MTDLRTLERDSIRAFVQQAADDGYLSGRVLDYGCGRQPYRDIVEAAGGEYQGYDRKEFPASVIDEDVGFIGISNWMWEFDTILCTQVVQYLPQGFWFTSNPFNKALEKGGHLVLTYPTNWPEVESEDLHRFTKAGMERLLTEAGFEIVRHESRAAIVPGWGMKHGDREFMSFGHLHAGQREADFFSLGGGVIARA